MVHRRIKKENDQEKQIFFYDGNKEIGHVSDHGEKVLRILGQGFGSEAASAIAIEKDEEIFLPLHDPFGNVTLLLDLQGKPLQTLRLSAFGEIQTDAKESKIPWLFSSKRFDPETGFTFFGRRYYSPKTGRFITPDPLGY